MVEFATVSGREFPRSGATLILPVNSIGNVGQLAVDLLVHNWCLDPSGQLLSDFLLPCVGNNAFAHDSVDMSTELQVFGKDDVVVLQQRAPASLGNEEAFAKEMVSWIQSQEFSQVVILGSIDAESRRDQQLEGGQLRYKACGVNGPAWLTQTSIPKLEAQPVGDNAWEDSLLPPWSNFRCLKESGIPCILLVAFASEGGGNTQEATIVASAVQQLIAGKGGRQPVHKWEQPASWAHVFGAQSAISWY